MLLSVKKLSVLVISLIAIIAFIYFRPQIAGYFAAPKFMMVHYSHTDHTPSSMCVIVCSYSDTYWYEAKGLQKDLAQDVVDTMAKKGFRLRDQNGVMCYGASGDDYIFEKDGRLLGISFFAKTLLPDVNTSAIGCERPYAEYKVRVES